MSESDKLVHAIADMREEEALGLVEEMVERGVGPMEILDAAREAMGIVGKRYEDGTYFLPKLMLSGEMINQITDILKPELSKSGGTTVGKYVIGTVKGDIHDIGKNIVTMMLEGNGWEVTDLGIDVSTEAFCKAVKDNDFQILGMSALLSTTIPRLAETIEALKAEGLRDKVKVMVGGVSVTRPYAEQIGADAYGRDAVDAVTEAKRLMGKS